MTSKEIINHYVYVGKFNSQTDLAKHLGVTSSRVTDWKSGDKIPDKHLNRLIRDFGHFEAVEAKVEVEKKDNTSKSFSLIMALDYLGYNTVSYSEGKDSQSGKFKASISIEEK